MSDFQTGRTSGVFAAGSRIDDLLETYEREATNLEAMKVAFGMAGKALENYREAMLKELAESRIPLKEAEYGKIYIGRCVELMRQMFNDTEAKRLQARGAAEAMKQAVASIKRVYDEERTKLSAQEAWEKNPNRDPKDRPVGADPGKPLDDYKKEAADEPEEAPTKKKSRRTKAGG